MSGRSGALAAACCALLACSSETTPSGSGGGAAVDAGRAVTRARFDLSEAPVTFGDVPWPDDLYLDSRGRIAVAALPAGEGGAAYVEELETALNALDGFGLRPTAYVGFEGAIDPESLPADARASLDLDAAVFLIDADTGSPDAFERIAIDVRLGPNGDEVRARPAFERALVPGRRYAFVVTDSLLDADGEPVAPSERFLAIRDPETPAPDTLDRRAQAQYAPVLETLDAAGVRREGVVALAVFRVQETEADMLDARAIARGTSVASPVVTEVVTGDALDARLGSPSTGRVGVVPDEGVAHEHLRALVTLTIEAPSLLPDGADEAGTFVRDPEDGELVVASEAIVPCTLTLPRSSAAGAGLPVAIVQHGFFGERSDALPIANALAASGAAVLACDAPLHGARAGGRDARNRFTGESDADGFGDASRDPLVGASTTGTDLDPHPRAYADALRQGSLELFTIVRLLEEGAFDAALDAEPELDDSALSRTELDFVGIDAGAELGAAVIAFEPAIGAAGFVFSGAVGVDGWLASEARSGWVATLAEQLGIEPEPPHAFAFDPGVDAFRALVDAATAFAHAPRLRRSALNLVLFMAGGDDQVGNAATEALAEAVGASLVGAEPMFVPDLMTDIALPGAAISGNFVAQDATVTRVLQSVPDATHAAFVIEEAATRSMLEQLAFFFESYRACRQTTPSRTCQASVRTLAMR